MKRGLHPPEPAIPKAILPFFVGVFWVSVLAHGAEVTTGPELLEDIAINSGADQVVLHKGTPLSILKREDGDCVVSLVLPDGTPMITQLRTSVIEEPDRETTNAGANSSQSSGKEKSSSTSKEPWTAKGIEETKREPVGIENLADTTTYPQFKLPSLSSEALLPEARYTEQTGSHTCGQPSSPQSFGSIAGMFSGRFVRICQSE